MTGRRAETRTWHPPAAPVARVQDPAAAALFRVVSRALKMIVAEIEKRCGIEDDETPS
jgi:hypothetical protein